MKTHNQISLYKKMTEELLNIVEVDTSNLLLSYSNDNEIKEIIIEDVLDNQINLNEHDDMWSPLENELRLRQSFMFSNPSFLYGEDGITMENNKIGIAVHIHSKTSNFQKTISFGTIPNQGNSYHVEFMYEFLASSLRGNIELDFFLFLQELNTPHAIQASSVGMILSEDDLLNLEIIVDGIGSEFPMSEFSEKEGPLWKIEKNWVEAQFDVFTSSNVNLSLNTAHPLFEQVKAGKTKTSRAMMGDILVQAMTMIIQQVLLIDRIEIGENEEIIPNSILAAVDYWVSTFEIDTASLFSINNTMKKYWDRKMMESGLND